jgi:ferredoxin
MTTVPTQLPPATRSDPRDALPRLDRHKPKCGPVRKSKAGRWRALVLIAVHVLVGIHIAQWLLTGRTVTPVEPSEAGYLLDEGKLNAGFVLFMVLIAGTLVFGRWFCGWACHVVALQDLSAWLLGKVGLRPRPVRSRLLVLAPFVVAFHMFFQTQLERWWHGAPNRPVQAAFMTNELWERFPGPLMGVLTVLVVGFLCVWWLGAKGFCTYGCPYGAFFAVADRFGPGKIKVTDACDACGHCTSVCTSNVRVHEEVAVHKQVVDPACMKCLDCVSVCPKDALYFGFAAPKPFAVSQQKRVARADFTWPEEIALALLALGGCVAFRGAWFGESVPFLMSVGLGAITAALGVVGWRLLRRPEFAFQHAALKRGGRLTTAGRWAALGIGAWLLLTAHTGVGRWLAADIEARERTIAGWSQAEQRGADLRDFDARVQTAIALSLVSDPRMHLRRGQALRDLGALEQQPARFVEAELELRIAIGKRPGWIAPMVPLADLLHLRGEDGEAEHWLRQALEIEPDNGQVQARLQQLEAGRKR